MDRKREEAESLFPTKPPSAATTEYIKWTENQIQLYALAFGGIAE